MMERIEKTIRERHLIAPGMHVLAGVSGGVDSVVLLYVLWLLRKRMSFRLSALHVHHGLRGRDADRDASLAKKYCARLGVPFHMVNVNVRGEQDRSGGSMEMAARSLRLDAFNRVSQKIGAQVVAVAHHRDDQAETILMRLLTGSGIEGLGGMDYISQPLSGLTIIRPMLDVSRRDVVLFAEQSRLSWREDRSNRDVTMLRNRIRYRVLPFLAQEGFGAAALSLARFAALMREEQIVLDGRTQELVRRCVTGGRIRLHELAKRPVADARRVIRSWLAAHVSSPRMMDFDTVERIRMAVHQAAQGRTMITKDLFVVWSGGQGWMERSSLHASISMQPVALNIPGVTEIPDAGLTVTVAKSVGFSRRAQSIGQYPCVVHIRRSKKDGRLMVRGRCEGDMIDPTGMSGTVSLKKLFIDRKVPAEERGMIPLIVSGDNDLVYVAGYRVARSWAVPSTASPSWKITIAKQKRRAS